MIICPRRPPSRRHRIVIPVYFKGSMFSRDDLTAIIIVIRVKNIQLYGPVRCRLAFNG